MKKYIIIMAIALAPVALMGQGIYSITYDMSYAVGSSNDYIDAPSFRGATLIDARGFVSDNVSVGGSFSWHVFYQNESGEFNEGNTTISGQQYRYVNSFPLMATSHYYFGDGSSSTWYAGGGVGVINYEQRTEMGMFYSGDPKWHFGIAPQIGVLVPMSASVDFHLSLQYHQAFKAGSYDANQYLTLKVGFAWW
jgi:hypothetical protein